MVPPCSDRITRVPPYSRISRCLPVRGSHPLWPSLPGRSGSSRLTTGLIRVRSPLLAESLLMSFPPGTEMFQFPGFASRPYVFRSGSPCGGVTPFGNPRINDRSHLPAAYRSVPRPSSPLGAKASTKCPYTLDTSCLRGSAIPSQRQRPSIHVHRQARLGQAAVLEFSLDTTTTAALTRHRNRRTLFTMSNIGISTMQSQARAQPKPLNGSAKTSAHGGGGRD